MKNAPAARPRVVRPNHRARRRGSDSTGPVRGVESSGSATPGSVTVAPVEAVDVAALEVLEPAMATIPPVPGGTVKERSRPGAGFVSVGTSTFVPMLPHSTAPQVGAGVTRI